MKEEWGYYEEREISCRSSRVDRRLSPLGIPPHPLHRFLGGDDDDDDAGDDDDDDEDGDGDGDDDDEDEDKDY